VTKIGVYVRVLTAMFQLEKKIQDDGRRPSSIFQIAITF
jgi:hypothetical protein